MKVMIFLGSESDFGVIEGAVDILKGFGVPFGLEVTSAHRSPEPWNHATSRSSLGNSTIVEPWTCSATRGNRSCPS